MDEVPVARLCVAGGNQYPSQTTLGNFYIAACKKITMTDIEECKNCWQALTAVRSLRVYAMSKFVESWGWMIRASQQPANFYFKTCPVNSDRHCIIAVGTTERTATERYVVLPL